MSLDPSTLSLTLAATGVSLDMISTLDTQIYTEDHNLLMGMLTRTLTELTDNVMPASITQIFSYYFQYNTRLTNVSLENIREIGTGAFYNCGIQELNMPNLQTAGNTAFMGNAIRFVDLPNLQSISTRLFASCVNLEEARFETVSSIGDSAFIGCTNLKKLILESPNIVTVSAGSNILTGTSITAGEGAIYVPADLIDTYKEDSGWLEYAPYFMTLDDV